MCLREQTDTPLWLEPKNQNGRGTIVAVVIGSDQGLVGQFNDVITEYAIKALSTLPPPHEVWAIGARVHARPIDAGVVPKKLWPLPTSVESIVPLVGQILLNTESRERTDEITSLYLFYNRHSLGDVYAPVRQRLLPLDESWRRPLAEIAWPNKETPEIIGDYTTTFRALLSGYLFVSLFRACAYSLESENANRLAAMERADKNIDELLETLNRTFHRLRESGIDEELFDVVFGFEALRL